MALRRSVVILTRAVGATLAASAAPASLSADTATDTTASNITNPTGQLYDRNPP